MTTIEREPVLTDIDVVRFLPERVAFTERADGDSDDTLGTLTGHFSTFNDWYEINSFFEGHFMERIAPGAFRKTLRERRDQIKVQFNHGRDMYINDKVIGRILRAEEDHVGAAYEVALYDTSYNRDLLPGLRDGQYGASFRFEIMADQWDYEPKASSSNPDAIPERTITETRVFEFGPVTWPANPSATAGMRSLTDDWVNHVVRERDQRRYDQLVARANESRTPAAPSQGSTGAAPQQAEPEPQGHHSSGMSPDQRSARLRELQLAELVPTS